MSNIFLLEFGAPCGCIRSEKFADKRSAINKYELALTDHDSFKHLVFWVMDRKLIKFELNHPGFNMPGVIGHDDTVIRSSCSEDEVWDHPGMQLRKSQRDAWRDLFETPEGSKERRDAECDLRIAYSQFARSQCGEVDINYFWVEYVQNGQVQSHKIADGSDLDDAVAVYKKVFKSLKQLNIKGPCWIWGEENLNEECPWETEDMGRIVYSEQIDEKDHLKIWNYPKMKKRKTLQLSWYTFP